MNLIEGLFYKYYTTFLQKNAKNIPIKVKKKKTSLKFTIDCTHPVEDSIMDCADFVSC